MTFEPKFTAQGKFYQIGHRQVPSVSTVLQTISSPTIARILKHWRNAERAAGRDPNRHAIRGTLLHQMAEAFLNQRQPLWELGNHPDVATFVPHLIEALGQLMATEGNAIATEQFVDGGWYAGTFDAQFASGLLIDIKSSEKAWPIAKDGPWLDVSDKAQRAWLQLMGYLGAMKEHSYKAAILVVTPQGFEIRRASFSESDLELWDQDSAIQDSLYCRYQQTIAQCQQRAQELVNRNGLVQGFGL